MDVALIRVLYAHSLLTAPRLALGRFAPGRPALAADPRWRGADVFLSLHNILPNRYPLDGSAVRRSSSTARGTTLGRALAALPRRDPCPGRTPLYAHAASELNEPRLLEMIRDGRPGYAWPYEAGYVWTTARAPWAIRRLRNLTRSTETDQRGSPRAV